MQHSAVRKNILDLNHGKYVQYLTTTIVVAVTYGVGLVLALLTKQIELTNEKQLGAVLVVTLTFAMGICTLLAEFKKRLDHTVSEIEQLSPGTSNTFK